MENLDFSKGWLLWIIAFLVWEGLALFNKKKGDTLSEHVWDWFSVKEQSSRKRTIRMVGLVGFMAWLSIHFVTGGKI